MLSPQPKRRAYRNKKILAAARDEVCLVNLPGCTGGGSDTVAAHSNIYDDGHGKGIKSDDIFVAFACSSCHDILDGRKKISNKGLWVENDGDPSRIIKRYHDRGIKRTIRRLLDLEVIK